MAHSRSLVRFGPQRMRCRIRLCLYTEIRRSCLLRRLFEKLPMQSQDQARLLVAIGAASSTWNNAVRRLEVSGFFTTSQNDMAEDL